jgi:CRISPR-associated protein Csb1
MPIDLTPLAAAPRLLFAIPLIPLQGRRFQPTGFPGLGAATFKTKDGESLLVESAQSMANRLELTIWDEPNNNLKPLFNGLSHVRVLRNGTFLTDTIREPHRLNSAYIEKSSPASRDDQQIHVAIKGTIFPDDTPLLNRGRLAETLLRYDIGSLIHGVFLESIDGRIRVARALSAFIEADGVRVAASGGVKFDHVNPSGITKDGFGNIPFARDEYTAEQNTLYVNLDLTQIRGYGLGAEAERLLILLSLYKLRAVLDEDVLSLRTACKLKVESGPILASSPESYALPSLIELEKALEAAIAACAQQMVITEVLYDVPLTKGKDKADESADGDLPDDTTDNGV